MDWSADSHCQRLPVAEPPDERPEFDVTSGGSIKDEETPWLTAKPKTESAGQGTAASRVISVGNGCIFSAVKIQYSEPLWVCSPCLCRIAAESSGPIKSCKRSRASGSFNWRKPGWSEHPRKNAVKTAIVVRLLDKVLNLVFAAEQTMAKIPPRHRCGCRYSTKHSDRYYWERKSRGHPPSAYWHHRNADCWL